MPLTGYRGEVQGSVQDAYFDAPLAGFSGQIASFTNNYEVIGMPAASEITAGLAVFQDEVLDRNFDGQGRQPAPYSVRNPSAAADTADTFLGIALRMQSQANDAEGVPVWAENTMVPVLTSGLVYVTTRAAVTAGAAVAVYRSATGTGTATASAGAHGQDLGAFDPASDTLGVPADHVDLPAARARWWQNAPANSIGIIQLGVF